MDLNITNVSYGMENVFNNHTCVLNQYAMVEATARLPIICLWLSIAIFLILLTYYIVLPFFKSWKHYDLWKEALPGFAFALSIWLPLILMYFTLDFSKVNIKAIEKYLLWFSIVLVISVAIYYRRRIKEWLVQHNSSQE
jgi:signal transduction histidine kinase